MGLFHPFRDYRRKALSEQPFPAEWSAIIARNVPYCEGLHPDEREHLEELIKVFIAEKRFEGCGGLAVTDEIRVTIAAQACLLLLNLNCGYYDRLGSIIVFPESFAFEREESGAADTVTVERVPVAGLSSSGGAVALSWPDSLDGARQPGDGSNVVFHEFAHQLDQLDGAMDGAPALDTAALYRDWARVLGAEYARLQGETERGIPSLISPYAATKPAEFFAVVTELFFEQPVDLQQQHPSLYDEFRQYFRQDPATRRATDMR
jgi:Mlc titration factor MtfA (ptsG expression regulator)